MDNSFLAIAIALIGSLACVAAAFEPDITRFPEDKASLPAHLENMRPGQVRDAIARGAPCLLPVGTLESDTTDAPLGTDADRADAALTALAKELNAVIAPTIWYTPTGYALSGPTDGTFDLPPVAFAAYVEEVILTLHAVGFKSIQIVPLHNPQGRAGPLLAACAFAKGDIFNNLWKDPAIGQNWWIAPNRDQMNWNYLSIRETPKALASAAATQPSPGLRLPLRLEHMRPSQLKEALAQDLPCYVPVGVLENHGNQNPIGCDAIETQDPLLLAAAQVPAVIAPTIWYGPTAYAVSGPQLASTDINGHIFQQYMDGVVTGLANLGFRHIVFVQCHQGGGAEQTGIDLAIHAYRARLAARPDYGPGWTTRLSADQLKHPRIELIGPPGAQYDHAGKNETSWMLNLRAPYTDLSLLRPNDYAFCWHKGGEANAATAQRGREMTDKLVARWIELFKEK